MIRKLRPNWFSLIFILLLCFPVSAAESDSKQLEVEDLVYEVAPDGSYLQVGNYGINRVGKVWRESEPGDLIPIAINQVMVGSRVKVRLVEEDADGLWRVENLYLLSSDEDKTQTAEPHDGEVRQLDGVWQN